MVSHPGLPQIRTCAFSAYGSSLHGFTSRLAIRGHFVDTVLEARSPRRVSCPRFRAKLPPSLPGSPRYRFPWIIGTMRRCDFLPALPPHFVAFAWRYHSVRLDSLPSPKTQQRQAWSVGVRPPHGRRVPVETTGSPKFLGNPNCFCAMFFDSGRTARPLAVSVMYSMAPARGTTRAPTT
jgi:hypothetical protein